MMHKIKIIISGLFVFITIRFFAQADTATVYGYQNKKYLCYLSFEAANKIHSDSVKGLLLIGIKFNKFPKEIFKYKNLQYLYIGSEARLAHTEKLSKKNQQVMDSLFKRGKIFPGYTEYYNRSKIKTIPKRIAELKYLEDVFLADLIINKRKFKKIYKYLPTTHITPDINELQDCHNGKLFGE